MEEEVKSKKRWIEIGDRQYETQSVTDGRTDTAAASTFSTVASAAIYVVVVAIVGHRAAGKAGPPTASGTDVGNWKAPRDCRWLNGAGGKTAPLWFFPRFSFPSSFWNLFDKARTRPKKHRDNFLVFFSQFGSCNSRWTAYIFPFGSMYFVLHQIFCLQGMPLTTDSSPPSMCLLA